jgi:hypothetical protein
LNQLMLVSEQPKKTVVKDVEGLGVWGLFGTGRLEKCERVEEGKEEENGNHREGLALGWCRDHPLAYLTHWSGSIRTWQVDLECRPGKTPRQAWLAGQRVQCKRMELVFWKIWLIDGWRHSSQPPPTTIIIIRALFTI